MDRVFPEGKQYLLYKYPKMRLNFGWEMRKREASFRLMEGENLLLLGIKDSWAPRVQVFLKRSKLVGIS